MIIGGPRSTGRLALLLLAISLVASSSPARGAAAPVTSADRQDLEGARRGMKLLMNGDPDAAIEVFRRIQRADPDSAVGYLFEADAIWWKIYLTTGDLVDPDVFDVVRTSTSPHD
ncbi:MAG TPA: hypothetical protein VKU44_01130, partial [Terriglobia bacterium]|nr:hypothetical protein [Terriglobia bacterium]